MIPAPLRLSLLVRTLSLLLPHTYFQPDEFYQALEPAHRLVFGYGYLTWEWRDLPPGPSIDLERVWPFGSLVVAKLQPYASSFMALMSPWARTLGSKLDWGAGINWDGVLSGGRMRSWLWPGVFVVVYDCLKRLGLDDNVFLLSTIPRIPGVLVAALTDYFTYRLSGKVIGHGSCAGALLLSLTSLFHAHLLPRSLSTSPETLLTTMALVYFPLPKPETPLAVVVKDDGVGLVVSRSMKDLTQAELEKRERDTLDQKKGDQESGERVKWVPHGEEIKVKGVQELNYVVMDRIGPDITPRDQVKENFVLAVGLASLAICIRPTTFPFWIYMGLEHFLRTSKRSVFSACGMVVKALSTAALVLAATTTLDYAITGRLYFAILTFIHQNILANISSFYGATDPFYHLVQSLPIMLFPVWYWWAQGYISALLPKSLLPETLATLDRPAGLRVLARALLFSITTLSFSPHSEWRFLHPYLPPLLLFALPPLFRKYMPAVLGVHRLSQAIRQYVRVPKAAFYFILIMPIVPYLYLNTVHGRAQVEVMNVLRREDLGKVEGVVILMPCHSTPWMSGLHTHEEGWFLTCEPPLGKIRDTYRTEQQMFYEAPVRYIDKVFPGRLKEVDSENRSKSTKEVMPSHVVLFGELLDRRDTAGKSGAKAQGNTVQDALRRRGYEEVWKRWNGLDVLQDETQRRGGVRVWRRGGAVRKPGSKREL